MIQSISDIITNSSSEVFVINTDNGEYVLNFLIDICTTLGYDLSNIMECELAEEDGFLDYQNYGSISYDKTDILIYSVFDNSIPSVIMDIIYSLSSIPILKDYKIKINRLHVG